MSPEVHSVLIPLAQLISAGHQLGMIRFLFGIKAVHAGPILITDGEINITTEEEVFFNTSIAGVQPRSAVGYTENGEIILMVVDGRQADSRGVYLEELALLMAQFNCVDAMNLDGGGSSALVINRKLINRPAGLSSQREVMSAIGIYHQD